MMLMNELLSQSLQWLPVGKYFLFYLVAVVEGPIVMTLGGFLLKAGYVNFWPVFLVFCAGDLTGDLFWYGIGYFWGHPFIKKYGRFFSLSDALVVRTEAVFKKHQYRVLFVSKITMGFGFSIMTLITAGMTRVSFSRFVVINVLGQCIWTGFLLSIGYFFGSFFLQFNGAIQIVSLIAFLTVVLFVLHGLQRYLRHKNIEAIL